MSDSDFPVTDSDQHQRLLHLCTRWLPLIDALTDKLRLLLVIGLFCWAWIGIWLYAIQHYSLLLCGMVLSALLLPVLIILRFWWSLAQLKDLPAIATEMLGDAQAGVASSLQQLATQKTKLSWFGASKGLWSIGTMALEAKELLGSYVSLATLLNPFMLLLGVVSGLCIGLLCLISLGLLWFI